MKKIVLSLFAFLCACVPSYDTAPKVKDYSQVPLLELPVQRVNIISDIEVSERLPHIENLMPLSPEKALKNWSLIRLRPNYSKKHKAEFLIEKAELIRQDAPEKSFFVYDNYKYILSYTVSVRILDEEQNELRRVSIDGFISRKLPQKASVLQRDNMFAQMLYEMEEHLDKQMAEEIKQKLIDI